MLKPRLAVLLSMILAAAASRLIPHPPNATSIAALALFSGAYLQSRWQAFIVPLTALFLGDLVLGFYSDMGAQYGSFALVVCLGFLLRGHLSGFRIAGAALAGSALFFLTTNFAVWAFEPLYAKTLDGLAACYAAALPFFWNTLQGDLFYTAALFGGFAFLEWLFPRLRERPPVCTALPA